jgi:hypothetical protein
MPRAEWAQVAHDLRALAESIDAAIEPSAARADVQGASRPAAAEAGVPPAPASAPLPKRPPQESAFTECPAHKQAFVEGKFGLYCTGKGEPDGNWINERGYCKVTPKSAGAWLKQHPKGAPAPVAQPQDVDDIPF